MKRKMMLLPALEYDFDRKISMSCVPKTNDYDFHNFSALPPELRSRIWMLALPCRLISISINVLGHHDDKYRVYGARLPSLFQVCQESRRECLRRYIKLNIPKSVSGCSNVRFKMHYYVSYALDTFLLEDNYNFLLDYGPDAVRLEKFVTNLGLDAREMHSVGVDSSFFHLSGPNPYTELRMRFAALEELIFVVSRPGLAPLVNYNFMNEESRLWDLCAVGFYWPREDKDFLEDRWQNLPYIPVLRTWKLQIVE